MRKFLPALILNKHRIAQIFLVVLALNGAESSALPLNDVQTPASEVESVQEAIPTQSEGTFDNPTQSNDENQSRVKFPKKAMTWTSLNSSRSADQQHTYALVGSDIATNPYIGDEVITQSLPILCINKANLPRPTSIPNPSQTPGGAWRGTWSGGYIGLTNPIQGSMLTSRSIADAICTKNFGAGYRMAEFHDGDASLWSGWDFWGEVVSSPRSLLGNKRRFWVSINDQPANPWP